MEGSLSLQERVMILLVAAILPLAALSLWSSLGELESETQLAQSQLQFAASLVAAQQDNTLESAEHLLAAISTMPRMRSADRNNCENYFEALRGNYPIYANVGIVDPQGNVICHANSRIKDFDIQDRPYFKQAIAERRFIMGEPVIGRALNRLVIPLALPAFEEGRITAVAFGGLDLGYASAKLASVKLPEGARVIVTDRQGIVLMAHPHGAGGELGALAADARLVEAARNMATGGGIWNDASGEPRIHAFAPGQLMAGEGFFAIVSIDKGTVAQASLATLRNQLLALAVTLVAGLAVAWWVGGRVIVAPAKQILGTARRLEQGQLDARVPLQPGRQRGEFARIGAAFNLMAESLQVRQRDLESELGRSRGAYLVLDLVLNSMHESLIAVTGTGQFLIFNAAASRLFPLDEPGLLPQQWAQRFGFYHEDKTTPYVTEELPLVRSARGESGRQELLFVRNALVPEGRLLQCSWQPIHSESGISGGLVVFTDVTELERLQAEQASQFAHIRELNAGLEARIAERTAELARQEQLFRTLAEQAPAVVWNTDRQGRATFLNRAWYDLVGGESADWLGHGWMKRLHPDDVPDVRRNWDNSRHSMQPYSGIRRFLAQDGTYHTTSYKAAPVLDEQGGVVFWVGVDADITELKAIEQALRSSNQELEAFSYSVSHDLRAPLAAVDGFSSALAARLEGHPDERVAHYLARIQAAVGRMEHLIEDLLSLARVARAPLQRGWVDLGALVRESLDALQAREPQRKVTVQVDQGLVAHGDNRLLRVMIENLLGNAWKFTSQREDARIEVGRVAGSSVFSVRDNGVGFDMAYAAKLFGAFQRLHTESEFPGTGIGLATVRRIVARHQGRVWAESRVGEGATFFFTLSEAAPPAWLAGSS